MRNVALACFVAGVAGGASGQCVPEWDTTLGNPGIAGTGYLAPMVAWDDGTGEKLYVGGSATRIGGVADFLGSYDPATGLWRRLGTGINQGSTNAFLNRLVPWNDGTGEKLYVVGQFNFAGGQAAANSFAVWNGSTWSDVGAGFDQTVSRVTYDLLPLDLGDGERLYMCGNWDAIGGVTAGGLASFDGSAFYVWGNGIGIDGGFSAFGQSLKEWDDGSGRAIYMCGRFDSVDGVGATNVARFNVNDNTWESVGETLVPTSVTNNMTSFAVFDDTQGNENLYAAGGQFRINGSGPIYQCAKWDGAHWTGVGQTVSGRITDLAVFDDGSGPALYASGTAFFEVGYFAKLVNDVWEPVLGSGVNNPATSGSFASAFGLYVWGDQLVVAGNFTQVGGLDPSTGVGAGTPIPARGLAAITSCACAPDLSPPGGDGMINTNDFFAFLTLYQVGDPGADFFADGFINTNDFFAFLAAYQAGC